MAANKKGKELKFSYEDVFSKDAFPLRVLRAYHTSPCGLHKHPFNELVVVEKGSGVNFFEDGEFDIQAGDAFLIPTGQYHGIKVSSSQLNLINIVWTPNKLPLVEKVPASFGYKSILESELTQKSDLLRTHGRLRLGFSSFEEIKRIIIEMEDEFYSMKPDSHFMAISHLVRLLVMLIRASKGDLQKMELAPGIENVLLLIETSYKRSSLSLDEMAERAKMSKGALIRAFKKKTNCTPFEYLLRARLSKAASLLSSVDESIGEIAMQCGFSDGNYLSRQFKKVIGISPKEYRAGARSSASFPKPIPELHKKP